MTTKSKSARIIALALLILPVHLRCGLALGADAPESRSPPRRRKGPHDPPIPAGPVPRST